jgi:hypothetical protein
MTTKTVATVDVMRYETGNKLGSIDIPMEEWEQYATCEHPAFQWPEGIAFAGEVLSNDQMEANKIGPMLIVFFE